MLTSECLSSVLNKFDSYSYYTVGTEIVIAIGRSGNLYCRGLAFKASSADTGLDSIGLAFANLLYAYGHKLDCICLTRTAYFNDKLKSCLEAAIGAKCPLYLRQYNIQPTYVEKLLLELYP